MKKITNELEAYEIRMNAELIDYITFEYSYNDKMYYINPMTEEVYELEA